MSAAPNLVETAAAAGRPAISLRGVSKRYGSQVALEPVDLDIQEGEFFCLLGPSGCGKTTTLNVIGGFVGASSGEVHIRGERVDHVPPHKRAVNTVFQSYALFPHMTVADNVGFGLKMAKVPRAASKTRVADALSMVALDEFADRLPTQLSGGQQQRVAVARALVNKPAVLLLDEPLGALDLKLRKRLQIELAQIHANLDTTFVLVTHDQEEAMSMANRIAVMNEGRVEQVGTPEQIYRQPVNRFVADFIGESNFVDVTIENGAVTGPGGVHLPVTTEHRNGPTTVMIRPEHTLISPAGEPGLPATIVKIAFLGSYLRVVASVDGMEEPVTAWNFGASADSVTARAGDRVTLTWDRKDIVVFDPDVPNTQGGDT